MKYYTLETRSTSSGTSNSYKGFSNELKEVDAKHLNPKTAERLGLVRIFKEGNILLDFYEDNIFVGEINGSKHYAADVRIDGAASNAIYKIFK